MRVHDSQAYRKMDITRERISRISELRKILLSFQTGFNLVNAAVVLQSSPAAKRIYGHVDRWRAWEGEGARGEGVLGRRMASDLGLL